jgi:tetratricopeptide (TPR) repeat protein
VNLESEKFMQNELSPAIALREVGNYKAAQECLSRHIEKHPNDPAALSLLSQVFMLDKNDEQAAKALSKASSINPELPSVHRNQARLLLKQSKPEEALAALHYGPEVSSNDPEDWLVLATCLGANQREQEALRLIEKVLQAIPNHAEAFANRAVLRLKAKDTIGAIEDAEMAVSLKPHLTKIWALLGYLRHQSNNLAGAIEAVKKAHEIDPTNLDHINNLSEFFRQDGEILQSIRYLEKASSLVPDDVILWTKLGVAFQQAQNIDDAKVAYEKALAINPKAAEVLSNLGTIAGDSQDWEAAVQYFAQALAVMPGLAEVHDNMGVAQKKLGHLDDAAASHKQAIALKPDYTDAYNNLGITQQALGRFEQAAANYQHAIALQPDNVDAYNNLGNVLRELSRPEQAAASYRQAIVLRPDYAEVHNNLGTVLNALGRLKQADASYRHAITLKPDSAEIHSNLGNVLRGLNRLAEAEASYKHAIALEPSYSKAYYDLGLLLLVVDRYEEAAEYLKHSEHAKSRPYLLRCLYLLDRKSLFYEQLDYLIHRGDIHPIIGSLISRSEIRYGINKLNLFCQAPLDYVLKTDLSNQYDFEKIVVKTASTILNEKRIPNRNQAMLINGYQTAGNIFDLEPDLTEGIKKIIRLEIEKYRVKFKDSKEGLITNWPKDYKIRGWLISMNNGGELMPHMHEEGWISGSIYINVPAKSKPDSGNLVVCIEDERLTSDNKNQLKSIDVVTGSLCLFPASLLHYTIPFEAEEERIVLAFDVTPKD